MLFNIIYIVSSRYLADLRLLVTPPQRMTRKVPQLYLALKKQPEESNTLRTIRIP